MDIVIQPNQEIIRQIGGPQYRVYGRKYRLNKYCLEHKIKEGTPIPTDDKVIDVTFEDTSPDAIKKVLYDEYKKHLNKED